MNRIINLAITILVLFVVNVLSQEPDELYVQIYDIIQIAENFSKSGDSKMALKKYLEAKSALEQFQKNYPQWNPNVIKYRLDFVSDKIAGLEKIQPKPTPTQTVPQQPQQQPVKTTQPQPAREIPQDIKDQIDFLQQQISQLKIERDQLQVKLKEALSVQPAAVDPGELARANEKIRNLEKQVELLQLSINQEREKSSNNITNTDINSKLKAMESQIATLIKDNATKEAKIQSLIAEKEALELSLKNKQPKADGENIQAVKNLEKELALANEKVIDLSKKLESITKEKAVLEKQVAALMSEQKSKGSRDKDIKRIKELEKENEELQKKLNALSKDYYNVQQKNQTAKLTDLENQIVALKARLDAYEMKAIPHTPEEIALMTKTELVRVRPEGVKPRKVTELSPDASRLLVDAQSDIELGKFDRAEAKLQEVLKYDSSHLSTLFRLASVQLEQNKLDEAERTINRALSIDPDDAGALFLLGVLNDRRGRLNESIEAFSKSLKSNPDNPDTQVYLGIVLSKKGLRPQAETAFRKALQIQPKNSLAHMNLAVIYATQNPPFIELAKWHYQKAIDNGAEKNPELEKKLNPSTANQ